MLHVSTASMIDRVADTVAAMEDFQDRLKRAMDLAGKAVPDLARALISPKGTKGVTPQAVYAVLRGDTKAMTAENVAHAARFLAVDWFWLATGAGSPRPTSQNLAALPIEELLTQVGIILAQVPKAARRAVADNLHGFALDGGADHYRAALLGLLSHGKRPSALS